MKASRVHAAPSPPVVSIEQRGAVQFAMLLLAILFVTVIGGHVTQTRQFWLLAVFLGLFFLSRRDMKRPFLALAFGLPFSQLWTRAETYTIAPVLEASLLAFCVLWFLRAAQGRASLPRFGPLEASVLLFLALATGSAMAATVARVWAEEGPLAVLRLDAIVFQTPPLAPLFPVRQLFIFLEAFLLFGFVRSNLGHDDVKRLAMTLLVSAALVLLVGAVLLVLFDNSRYFRGVSRATSVFLGPNEFATYLLMLVPLAAAVAHGARTWMARWLGVLVAGGGALMLFFTRSQGAWLAALTAPVLAGLFFQARVTRLTRLGRVVLAGGVLAGTAVCVWLLATQAPEQINALSDGRYFLYRAALRMLQESPLFGVGLGNFFLLLGSFYPAGIEGRAAHEHAHNMFLQILAELGPLGLVAFARPLVTVLARAARAPGLSGMAWGLLVAVLAVLVHSLTDYTLWMAPMWLLFWMLLGALAVSLDATSGTQLPAERLALVG
ncbi:O-antigen ligase family protein [Archangium lansingense]|uniref:O-antigen ligase family protein n=1 Tax=Archangium lansingense TaxID=2995310 RepID=UPI003B7B5519